MRLVQLDGHMENEGRVEYCSSSRWGLVCFDFWDANDARVICRQLGYNVQGKPIMLQCFLHLTTLYIKHAGEGVVAIDTSIGRSPPPIFLVKVDCAGSEESITECPQDNNRVCLDPGAGVVCPLRANGRSTAAISTLNRHYSY